MKFGFVLPNHVGVEDPIDRRPTEFAEAPNSMSQSAC